MKYKLVYVLWEDARGIGSSWRSIENVIEELTNESTWMVHQVGWIIHEDKKSIVMAASIDDREEVGKFVAEGIRIPKVNIRKRKTLKI